MRLGVYLKEFGVAVAAQLGVVEQAAQSVGLGGRVYAVLLRLVLEEVHVAADARVGRVDLLALLGHLVADHVACVLAHEFAAFKVARGKHAAALVLDHLDFEALLAHLLDRLLHVFATLLVYVRLAFAGALADLKVVGYFPVRLVQAFVLMVVLVALVLAQIQAAVVVAVAALQARDHIVRRLVVLFALLLAAGLPGLNWKTNISNFLNA